MTKADITGERLLRIAAKLFREKGYAQTTVRDIARVARMKPGSLYYHYPSKEKLLESVIDRGFNTILNAVSEAVNSLPPDAPAKQRLRAAVAAHLRANFEYGDYAVPGKQLLDRVPAALRRKYMRARDQYDALWRDLFEAASAEGAFRAESSGGIARMFVLGSLNWTVEWVNPGRKSFESLADAFVDLDYFGHAPREGERQAASPPLARRA